MLYSDILNRGPHNVMKILVGYRRLYEAVGCNLPTEEPVTYHFGFQKGIEGMIYIGPNPLFGIYLHSADERFLVLGKENSMGKFEFHQDPQDSNYGDRLFFEATVMQIVEADKQICELAIGGDKGARDDLLKLAEADSKQHQNRLATITGIIGLRIHRQFVLSRLNENAVVVINGKSFSRHHSAVFEVVEAITINQAGKTELERIFGSFEKAKHEELENIGVVLGWLERAWTQMDPVAKFTSCFIPIECILGSVRIPISETDKQALRKIGKLITKYGEEDKEGLRTVFEKYRKPRLPSLEERFEVFATEADFPNSKADIAAFKKFNKMRNALHHRGDSSANVIISIDDEIAHSLEDIAERYVNYAIFRDQRVYQSCWRPKYNLAK